MPFALNRSIAEETAADLEKKNTMQKGELKDLLAKHRNEMSTLQDVKYDMNLELSKRRGEEDLATRKLQDELAQAKVDQDEFERLQQKHKTEALLKQKVVNKLAKIMNLKDLLLVYDKSAKKKMLGSAADSNTRDKAIRQVQQKMQQERDKFNELRSSLAEEVNQRTKAN